MVPQRMLRGPFERGGLVSLELMENKKDGRMKEKMREKERWMDAGGRKGKERWMDAGMQDEGKREGR